jgi:two-component system cell cycle response regulator
MSQTNKKLSQRVVFLCATDEMRYPYEAQLKKVSLAVDWFTNLEDYQQSRAEENPLAVIVDIDLLSRPLEPHLENLRQVFPHSDLIALSGSDSAQTALLCIRSGMTDYLLKPISPEELLWSVKKAIQRTELFQKLQDPEANFVRALTHISGCSTPSLIRLSTLEFLKSFVAAEAAAWISLNEETTKVLCSIPRGISPVDLQQNLPHIDLKLSPPPALSWSEKARSGRVFLTCLDNKEAVLLWGASERLEEEKLLKAKTLLEHSELSLLNLQKFEEIKQQTFVDELTGLYNSRYLKFSISNSINRCKGQDKSFAVLFIDVDYFKSVNTQHGHVVGSDFLVAIGKSIRNTVREIDPVFRYGGDEFIVILNDSSQEGAYLIAERIRKGIERRVFSIQGLKLQTTVSIGLAMYPEHAKNQEALLKFADLAMYSAKELSRNKVHIYTPETFENLPKKIAS